MKVEDNVNESFKSITNEMAELLIKKNNDYGNSATDTYRKHGDISYLIRLTDKMNRLNSLIGEKREILITNESLDDTIKDIMGYCVLWIRDRKDTLQDK